MKILMVCLGNICRSPLAQGILEQKCRDQNLDWTIDSAGTSSWHIGQHPDKRAINVARLNEVDISQQRSRQIQQHDLNDFDLIMAMDQSNFNDMVTFFDDNLANDKIKLILNYVYPDRNMAVPDPYHEGNFDRVYKLLDQACQRIIEQHSSV